MDTILQYLVDNKSDKPIYSETIWKAVYPDQEEEVVYMLLKRIMNCEDPVVISHIRKDDIHDFQVFFEANALTTRFLQQGGFTKEHNDEQTRVHEQQRIADLELQKLESEVDIVKFQRGLGKRLTIWGFIIALISVLASVVTTFAVDKTESVGQNKIDSLANRLNHLEAKVRIQELKNEENH